MKKKKKQLSLDNPKKEVVESLKDSLVNKDNSKENEWSEVFVAAGKPVGKPD